MMSSMSKNKQTLLICIFLTVATLTVYWQVGNCEFNNYDDEDYVTKNIHVQDGITLEGIRWAFTTGHTGNWLPLTWISHMLDVQFFGLQPRWHHLTNLLFHLANTLLLFFVLHRMTKALWKSAFVAALFALHPLHVESVAWVAERKDVLSAFFWMLAIAAYCSYVERPNVQRYLSVVVIFVLGLMAKPMLVTLPFVLLLLDYWPLQRFRQWALIRPLLWEKIPLFVLTVLSCIVTYMAQQKEGAVASFEAITLKVRIENAFVSYITYIGKMIWPNDLAVLYPYPIVLPTVQVVGAAFLLTAITITVIGMAKKVPYAAVGWLWYVGTLVPVIGIVQVGLQSRADRYTYLPLIGLFIMAAWGVPELLKERRYRNQALIAASTVVLLCLSFVAWKQVGYWRNSITLFEQAVKVTENNYTAYYNLGDAYAVLGNYQQAIGDYDKVLLINPKFREAYNNRGNAFAGLGNYQQAIGDYDKALSLNPKHETAYNNRGNAYYLLGSYQQAIGDYDKAIGLNPNYAEAYSNRGYAYSNLGITGQAIEDLKTAARLGYEKAQQTLKSRGIVW